MTRGPETVETPGGSIPTRLVVETSAAADLVLRTAAASAISAAALPWALSSAPRRDRERLRFYAELASADIADAFPPPPRGVEIAETIASRRAPRIATLTFRSPFETQNPAIRDEYASYTRNAVARAQLWRHAGGPRPTLCVIHGFFASPFRVNAAFFSLPWFYHRGYDVLLYVMPFHGSRHEPRVLLNGAGLFAHGVAHLNEAIAQAVCDFRVIADHLLDRGAPAVGVTGLSLGGYVSALLAAVEPRLGVAIPNAPVADIWSLASGWLPANLLAVLGAKLHGMPLEDIQAALRVHSPLHWPAAVARERLMIIGGLGDRLAPPDQARALWEHWQRPRIHWFPGNHTVHLRRSVYLREMAAFMAGNGFAAVPADAARRAA